MATKITPKKTAAKKPVKKKSGNWATKLKWFLLKVLLWFFGISIASVVLFKFVPVPLTPLMVTRYFENTGTDKENL
mgnify:FL=1